MQRLAVWGSHKCLAWVDIETNLTSHAMLVSREGAGPQLRGVLGAYDLQTTGNLVTLKQRLAEYCGFGHML